MSAAPYSGVTHAERRRFPRKPLKLKLNYQCVDRQTVSSPVRRLADDLGAGGLAMHSEHALEPDQLLMLNLFLPPRILREAVESGRAVGEEESQRVAILSRVAWCAPDKAGGYNLGVQFLDMSREDRLLLKAFLVDYRLYKPDPSLNL